MIAIVLSRLIPRVAMTAAIVSVVACTNKLKDYTQVTMQASPLEGGPQLSAEDLDQTKTILETRLAGLGVELAEVETVEADQIVVRLPLAVNAQAAIDVLTNTGQLYLRNQKPDTEAELASNIADLQRLLIEQNTLAQTGKQTEADALQTQIDETRRAISDLFEPATITGDQLYDARLQRSAQSNDVWEVNIQFDEEGADRFAEQSKLMAGTGRSIGLFLDDVLLSTPLVDVAYAKNGITGGTALVSGNFTKDAAQDLQVQLKSGALPVMLEAVELISTSEGSEGSGGGEPSEPSEPSEE